MHNQIKTALRLSALSVALISAGCGGGGGDSSSGGTTGGNMTVQGTAAKGIIKNGVVKVFEIGNDGKPGTSPVATGKTAVDGTYSLTIPKSVLNFIVEVSADANSTMLDEIKGEIKIPDGLKLRNVVALAQAQDAYTGHISPLTELAVKTAANATGGLSKNNIDQAKAAVTTMLGFNPEQVKPVNFNSDAASTTDDKVKKQSLILAAVSQMAASGMAGCPQDNLVCVVDKVTAPATIASGKTTFNDVLSTDLVIARQTVAQSASNKTGITQEQVLNDFSLTQKEVGTTPTPASGVDAAKQLFASLRNTSQALQNASAPNGALTLGAEAIRNDFSQSISPLDSELLDWMSLIPAGIEFFENYKAGIATNNDPMMSVTGTPSPNLTVFRGWYPIGGCTVYSDQDGKTVATSKDNAVSVGCSTYQRWVYNSYVYDSTGFSEKLINKGITLIPNGTNAYSYKARAKSFTTTYTFATSQQTQSAPVTIGTYGDTADARATGTITYTKSGALISGFTVDGMMPARVDYVTGTAITDHELWKVSFARTDEGSNVFKYALSGDLTSKKGGNVVGHLALASGSFVRVKEDGNGNSVDNGLLAVSLLVTGEAGSSKIGGSLTLSDGKTDKSGYNYLPTRVSFTGTLSNKSAEVFSGTVLLGTTGYENFDPTKPVSSINQYKGTLQLNGKIAVPNRPALNVLVSAERSIASDIAENIHGQYNDGTAVINAFVTHTTAGDTFDVSSANGVSFKVVPGQTSADVMKDSAKVGVIDLDKGVVNFTDGAFESLK